MILSDSFPPMRGGLVDNLSLIILAMSTCMDERHHDTIVHPTSYASKQVEKKSQTPSETIEWEQIPRYPTLI
jgi:hypothetical protein